MSSDFLFFVLKLNFLNNLSGNIFFKGHVISILSALAWSHMRHKVDYSYVWQIWHFAPQQRKVHRELLFGKPWLHPENIYIFF